MYVSPNFRTQKALREAVKAGKTVTVYSPAFYPCPQDGRVSVEGPHYPEPHVWYANVMVKDGVVVKVLK